MKGADKTILLALPMVALLVAFWLLIVSPKRDEASQLETQVSSLQQSVSEQEQLATDAEAARRDFPSNYRRLVVLGKAVPEDADSSSLLVQLSGLADRTNVDFEALSLAPSTSGAAAPAPATPAATDVPAQPATGGEAATPVSATPTEQAVATLPIGATVGPAGLPVMPYQLSFGGRFFDVTDFIGKLDNQVGLRNDGTPSVFGRLVTIDGFSIKLPDSETNASTSGGASITNPTLSAQFAVTTFLTPAEQGLTAGASPAGPAPAQPQPVSSPATGVPAPPTASLGGSVPTGGTR